jgi:hypothetical protein
MGPFTEPIRNKSAFNCPHCNAFANQAWGASAYNIGTGAKRVEGFFIAICTHCHKPTYWFGDVMIYPNKVTAPLPNQDLPEDIKTDYEEARQIANLSPRGAAALLRLIIQKICVHLGEKGKNINEDIAKLVAKGLPELIQRSLDIVRVVGNESVHPGTLDLRDDPATVSQLFILVNLIAEDRMTRPKMVAELWATLPEDKRKQIEQRDQPKS